MYITRRSEAGKKCVNRRKVTKNILKLFDSKIKNAINKKKQRKKTEL